MLWTPLGTNGGVSTTIARSTGCASRYCPRLGTTTSMVTSSAKKASQIRTLRASPIACHGSPTLENCRIVVGMLRTAAMTSGFSKRRWTSPARASVVSASTPNSSTPHGIALPV